MKKWYVDWDGDRYHSDETVSGSSPGTGWILETKGIDCDDNTPTITIQCFPSTCKNCNPVINEVAVIDTVLPVNKADYGYIDANGNVLIKSQDGTYKKPSQLNPNSAVDRKALNEIAASLARSLDGMNKNIVITSADGDESAAKNPAFTRKPPGTLIVLNSKGGFSKSLDNVNNLKSTIKHEIFHVDDNKIPNFDRLRSLATHADVYIKAAKHDSFKNTTEKFQIENTASFALYLINMDKDPNPDYGQNLFVKK